MGNILCDVEYMKISCYLIRAGWHLYEGDIILGFNWLSCSGCDLTLIVKSHTLNCYSFLLKSLLKTNCYSFLLRSLLKTNLLLVTGVAQFTAKTTNSERAIYILSLKSCSINIKSYISLFCFPVPPFSRALLQEI